MRSEAHKTVTVKQILADRHAPAAVHVVYLKGRSMLSLCVNLSLDTTCPG